MRLSSRLFRLSFASSLLALTLVNPGWADPVSIPPPALVDGKVPTYARVKKHGLIWYPASVVGYHRGISFAYDYATHKLFADGMETHIETVVVEDIVYVNLTPKVTQGDMRPGMNSLQLRRAQLKAKEAGWSQKEGNTDALFMSENVPSHPHPWTEAAGDRSGPLIDLDPTSEAELAPHMRPGARPPEAPPEALPNRLPRPGENQAAPEAANTNSTNTQGIPLQVTTEGGPSASTGDVTGLMPIPKAPEKAPDTNPFRASGKLQASSSENSVFKVNVLSGQWQVNQSDRILRLKLNQQNLSRVAQSNLGQFAIRCEDGSRVQASRTRSYLPKGTLDPGAARDGDLVFRFSSSQQPKALELEGALQLAVPLQMK